MQEKILRLVNKNKPKKIKLENKKWKKNNKILRMQQMLVN